MNWVLSWLLFLVVFLLQVTKYNLNEKNSLYESCQPSTISNNMF